MFKRILIISILFFLLALGIAGYFIFIKKPVTSQNGIVDNGFPFGSSNGRPLPTKTGTNTQTDTTTSTTNPTQVPIRTLMHLSSTRTAGIVSLMQGSTTLVRFVEAGTGHVYETNLTTGTSTELSNTTVSGIYDAYWLNSGKNIVMRSANTNNTRAVTYASSLNPQIGSSTPYELNGSYLPQSIESVAVSPDSQKLFYLVFGGRGEEGVISYPDGSKGSLLINSPFAEWVGSWPTPDTIALATKSAAGLPGSLYFVSIKNTLMRQMLSGINGLSAVVSPKADFIAYSDDNATLRIFTVSSGTSNGVNQTFAEKCIWGHQSATTLYCGVPTTIPAGQYPDIWYQGLISFTDTVYKIDATNNQSSLVTDLKSTYGQDIDIVHPTLSPDDSYLLFINKKDGTLWSLKIR